MKLWQHCAATTCPEAFEFSSLLVFREELTDAGWTHERQPYDTTRHWYCPTHSQQGTKAA